MLRAASWSRSARSSSLRWGTDSRNSCASKRVHEEQQLVMVAVRRARAGGPQPYHRLPRPRSRPPPSRVEDEEENEDEDEVPEKHTSNANPSLLRGYTLLQGGLASVHCIPFFFREQADLGALSQKNMPLGCAKAGPHTGFIAPLLPNPPCALQGVANEMLALAHFAESVAVRRRHIGAGIAYASRRPSGRPRNRSSLARVPPMRLGRDLYRSQELSGCISEG